ncbi:indole-2-monooxygenase-like [Miscanthus floridulus]|uniref:indole-2-monooxygenase-like n=1 Tax=Miscanthus floridulus TaxID=154761 RepID=UPI003457CDBA
MPLQLGSVPNLVASSPHAAPAVLHTLDHVFASRPTSKVLHNFLYRSSTIGFGPYGDYWWKVRLVMAKLKEAMAAGMAVDMSNAMDTFTNDIVCCVVSGKFFRQDGQNKTLWELIEMNSTLYAGFSLENYFPWLGNSLAEQEDGTDFVDVMLSVQQEYSITRDHIKDVLMDMFNAGTSTSFLVLELAMTYLESWEKAEKFMPERFRDGGSAATIDLKGNDFQFIPFGAGRRMCPGINFGLATVEIMLANLLY